MIFQCLNPKCKKKERNPDILKGCGKCNRNLFQVILKCKK
jgi:predicted  nucleic acid-binding Zn-ribbon protein